MRSTKIRPLPTDRHRKEDNARRTKTTCAEQKDGHRFTHQIANQLTVINLSCFKIRHAAAKILPPASLEDLERIEKAVAEIASLVQLRIEDDPPPQTAICCVVDSPQE